MMRARDLYCSIPLVMIWNSTKATERTVMLAMKVKVFLELLSWSLL